MRRTDTALLVFCKYPEAGKVKTRLAQHIGPDAAADYYKKFIHAVLKTGEEIFNQKHIVICFTPAECEEKFKQWLGPGYRYLLQKGADLGQKLHICFHQVFERGYERAIVIGSDSPDLPTEFLKKAGQALTEKAAVIGPTYDGGYYLLGFNQADYHKRYFHDIEWSTDTVFQLTKSKFTDHNVPYTVLPKWYDVDTKDDLDALFERGFSY